MAAQQTFTRAQALRRRLALGLAALLAASVPLFATTPARAAAPAITVAGEQDRHPTVSFTAPRADSVTVYIASKPDRASDGSFLEENVVETGSLTDSEIQSGHWLDSSQVDPGSYFVMLKASRDYASCVSYDEKTFADINDPACADGFSIVRPLTVAAPTIYYSVKAEPLKEIRILYITLKASPFGGALPYEVCWKQPKGKKKKLKKKCVSGTVDGYSWNEDATDQIRISTKGMTRRTKFTWYTQGETPAVLLSKMITVS